jgi:hypothetical protein
MSLVTHSLTACAECDGLQRIPPLQAGAAAYCSRCGGEIFRCQPHSLDRTLSFLVAAAVLFIGANANDLMELHSQGIHTSTSIFGTAVALRDMAGRRYFSRAAHHHRASGRRAHRADRPPAAAADGNGARWTRYAYLPLPAPVGAGGRLCWPRSSRGRASQIAEAYTSAGLFAVGGYVMLRASRGRPSSRRKCGGASRNPGRAGDLRCRGAHERRHDQLAGARCAGYWLCLVCEQRKAWRAGMTHRVAAAAAQARRAQAEARALHGCRAAAASLASRRIRCP